MNLLTATGLALPGRLSETNLGLEAGMVACLIGPNGSGKTSLLHAVAGIGGPAGQVRIGDTDPWRLGPGRRQRLFTFLPASRDVKWPLNAIDLIRLGSGDANHERLLADLELEEMTERRLDRLSTGERSRVLIARALAPEPRLLLLDEPVANLDPRWQLRLMDYLKALARARQCTVLMAVHDLELARRYADRLILMNGGRIAAEGDPHELLGGPLIPAVFGVERRDGLWQPV